MSDTTTTRDEQAAIDALGTTYQIEHIERRSERAFDLSIDGTTTKYGSELGPIKFSGWLPLAVIGETDWTVFADLSDYPQMVREGDWSGIRDSSDFAIWEMFEIARAS